MSGACVRRKVFAAAALLPHSSAVPSPTPGDWEAQPLPCSSGCAVDERTCRMHRPLGADAYCLCGYRVSSMKPITWRSTVFNESGTAAVPDIVYSAKVYLATVGRRGQDPLSSVPRVRFLSTLRLIHLDEGGFRKPRRSGSALREIRSLPGQINDVTPRTTDGQPS